MKGTQNVMKSDVYENWIYKKRSSQGKINKLYSYYE